MAGLRRKTGSLRLGLVVGIVGRTRDCDLDVGTAQRRDQILDHHQQLGALVHLVGLGLAIGKARKNLAAARGLADQQVDDPPHADLRREVRASVPWPPARWWPVAFPVHARRRRPGRRAPTGAARGPAPARWPSVRPTSGAPRRRCAAHRWPRRPRRRRWPPTCRRYRCSGSSSSSPGIHGSGRCSKARTLAQQKAMSAQPQRPAQSSSEVAEMVTGTRNRKEKGFSSPPVR